MSCPATPLCPGTSVLFPSSRSKGSSASFITALLALALCSVSLADADVDDWNRCSEEWVEEHWDNGEWDGVQRGYVLCNTLTMRLEPSESAAALCALDYGAKLYVYLPNDNNDEWYHVVYMPENAEHAEGYLKGAYVLLDPEWYAPTVNTPIYAYPTEDAKRVALMPRGKRVAIIYKTDEYYIVSLRGASGYILK